MSEVSIATRLLKRSASPSRLCWRLAYPFAWLSHRCFGTSYAWVNAGYGAWLTPETGFGPMWHWRWYGEPVTAIPERVNLCGIAYRVTVAEGLVLFRCDDGMSATRMEFTRDPYDRYGFMWYAEIRGRCAVSHLEAASEWVKAVYGGSHEMKRRPVRDLGKGGAA